MKLFSHKHKYRIRTKLVLLEFKEEIGFEEAVVLDCICEKCENSGKMLGHRVSELQGAFEGGRDEIVAFLDNYDSSTDYAKSRTYNDPAFWEHLCKVGFNNQQRQ